MLAKSSPLEDVVTAVGRAARGEAVVTDSQRMSRLRAADHQRAQTESALAPFRRLTPREEEVLAALVDGEPAVEIADRATVSEATVRVPHPLGAEQAGRRVAAAGRRQGPPRRLVARTTCASVVLSCLPAPVQAHQPPRGDAGTEGRYLPRAGLSHQNGDAVGVLAALTWTALLDARVWEPRPKRGG